MTTTDIIREARLRAAEAHAEMLGDASACLRAKSGQAFPAGKFWEGQTSALGELLRSGAEDLESEAVRLHEDWARRPVPGEPREAEAYRAGGLEALHAVVAGEP